MTVQNTKVTVYMTPHSVASIDDAARLLGTTRTTVINHGVQLYAWLRLEQATGAELLIARTVEVRRPWWLWLFGPFALLYHTKRRTVQGLELEWPS